MNAVPPVTVDPFVAKMFVITFIAIPFLVKIAIFGMMLIRRGMDLRSASRSFRNA